ncbi:hypothetical protein LXT21_08915 [Myxococcus sp. K38C18041901]|uniref:hypothetical protein n=1 Tax=Myxococcus guangdongensis TaxID=2906760 RepID=UPI0020A72E1F|nr:hypothetical protein [Myxococcus guangdongensis]MCP3058891.1 hypothetical protein [Myxococcus guangdongensis]
MLWQATLTRAPREPGLNIGSLPANAKQVLDARALKDLRAGLAALAPKATTPRTRPSTATPFSPTAWKKTLRSVDNKAFAAAWLDAARHNLTARAPLGISQALAAVDPHAVPPVALLKQDGKLRAPHGMLKHVVMHADARARRIVFVTLGTFGKTPFVPHFIAALEHGRGEDQVAAVAALLLTQARHPDLARKVHKHLSVVSPTLRTQAQTFLRRHGLVPG